MDSYRWTSSDASSSTTQITLPFWSHASRSRAFREDCCLSGSSFAVNKIAGDCIAQNQHKNLNAVFRAFVALNLNRLREGGPCVGRRSMKGSCFPRSRKTRGLEHPDRARAEILGQFSGSCFPTHPPMGLRDGWTPKSRKGWERICFVLVVGVCDGLACGLRPSIFLHGQRGLDLGFAGW